MRRRRGTSHIKASSATLMGTHISKGAAGTCWSWHLLEFAASGHSNVSDGLLSDVGERRTPAYTPCGRSRGLTNPRSRNKGLPKIFCTNTIRIDMVVSVNRDGLKGNPVVSDRQLAANRANALKSTGPRT